MKELTTPCLRYIEYMQQMIIPCYYNYHIPCPNAVTSSNPVSPHMSPARQDGVADVAGLAYSSARLDVVE